MNMNMNMNMQAIPREPSPRSRVLTIAALMLGACACVWSFYTVGEAYGAYRLPQAGVDSIPAAELAFYGWYTLFGSVVCLLGAAAAAAIGLESRLPRAFALACAQPRRCVATLSLVVFGGSLAFRELVLAGQPIADDEQTYLFIARTLLSGRLTNPPPLDPDFFRNQFVVLNDHAWYGKYPIGHPLWLALGEALQVRALMGPLAGALCVVLTYAVGRHFVSERRALLAVALLAVSPHFVWTCGSLLSQPTSCLVLLSGTWLLLRSQADDSVPLALLSGAVFGFGVLVRPLPGGLFLLVAGGSYALRALAAARGQRARAWFSCAGFVALGGLGCSAFLGVNYLQTGNAFSSGYHEAHGTVTLFGAWQSLANSLFGAALRENFWLLGVPAAFLPLLCCRLQHRRSLWVGLIAAELAYRLLAPKTVLSTTGPIYMTEIVPLLTLAAADGMIRLADCLPASWRARWGLGPATLVAAGALAAFTMFWPVALRAAGSAAEARGRVFRALAESHAERALVFADALVYPASAESWAYFPDNPSPQLDDDVLFVRVPKRDPLREVHDFWRRRYADRRAFLFMWSPSGQPLFRELQPDP